MRKKKPSLSVFFNEDRLCRHLRRAAAADDAGRTRGGGVKGVSVKEQEQEEGEEDEEEEQEDEDWPAEMGPFRGRPGRHIADARSSSVTRRLAAIKPVILFTPPPTCQPVSSNPSLNERSLALDASAQGLPARLGPSRHHRDKTPNSPQCICVHVPCTQLEMSMLHHTGKKRAI